MSQISHIKYKDIIEAWRYDADYFLPDFIETKEKLSSIPHVTFWDEDITSLFVKWVFDIWADNYCDNWIPFVRISNLKNQIIDTSDIVYIPEDINEKNKKTELKYWDIILSKTWWPACSFVDIEKCNTSQDTIAVKIKKDSWISTRFLTVFFNSKYWELQLLRAFTWNVQMHLSLDEGKKILIPKFTENFQNIIDNLFDSSLEKRKQSKQLYQKAEDLLLPELWLKGNTFTHTLTFSTTKKGIDNAWRYDADYFQPKYDELIEKIENYKGGWSYLENCIKVQDKNFIPEEWKLYKYIALANVSAQWFISDCEENYWENLPTRARRILHKWDVIVSSIEWSLSSCAVIEDEFDWWLCSNWFYVLKSDSFNSECLLVLFKSNIIQALLKKWCSWTILTAISKDELNKIKLPLINSELQKEISDKIKESFKLRNESKELLEQAKKMVEDEIEKE